MTLFCAALRQEVNTRNAARFPGISPAIFQTEPLTRYLKLRVAHAPGMSGTFSSPQRVSDADMHHGNCMTHVPWCMSGSLTSISFEISDGENVPGILGACATRNCRYLARGPCRLISENVGNKQAGLCYVATVVGNLRMLLATTIWC